MGLKEGKKDHWTGSGWSFFSWGIYWTGDLRIYDG